MLVVVFLIVALMVSGMVLLWGFAPDLPVEHDIEETEREIPHLGG